MRRIVAIILMMGVVASIPVAAMAAPSAAIVLGEGKGQVTLTWDEFVKITGYDPSGKGSQTLTIPWDEVQKLLGDEIKLPKTAATVDLPWKDFKALLEWSIARKTAKPETPPPTDYVVAATEYGAAITDEQATITMTVTLNVLRKKGWKRIKLLPGNLAVTKSTLPAGAHLYSTGSGYELLTEGTGEMTVVVEFATSVQKSAGVNTVLFSRLLPGTSVLDLSFDRKDVDVKVSGAQSLVTKAEGDKTRVAAAIPTGPQVMISWQRALPKVVAAPSKLYAETRALVAVAEGVLLGQQTVTYNILHSPIRELRLAVPKGVSVLTVLGSNMRDWRVEKDELSVVLSKEIVGTYAMRVTYERAAGEAVEAPVLRVVGVERERGYVGVVAVSNVEIAGGDAVGATAIDVRRLPGDMVAMTKQPILLAYRYFGKDLTIPLSIKRHGELSMLVTVADSALFTCMQLNDGRRITKALYNVRNNRNQFLRLTMPKGAEIWSATVGGKPVAAATDDTGRVLIPLIRSSGGSSELAAFPVEIVYVETPSTKPAAKGAITVALPQTHAPVMHVMVSFYAPAEGKYGEPGGLFGGKTTGFTGPLRLVDKFAALAAGNSGVVVPVNAAQQAGKMQVMVDRQMDAAAAAAGATPIRVRLPINGTLFRLEKILALRGDKLSFKVDYSGWKVPE